MTKPFTPWDATPDFTHQHLVWWSTLGSRYRVEVHRTAPYQGVLFVFDHLLGDAEIKSWPVAIDNNALCGPSPVDVNDWKSKVSNFIACLGGG